MSNEQTRSAAVWPTRRDMSGCYVRCVEDNLIEIGGLYGRPVAIERSEARLLAKRLNECLDATVKR